MKAGARTLTADENGATMMLAMVLLTVGALVFAPLLGLMSTGLMAGKTYEGKTAELYGADAGVEDALWQIKNDLVAVIFPDYDAYDYYGQWGYNLTENVNDKTVDVTIQNVWVPMGISVPDAYTARQIIEEGKVIITGSPALVGSSRYEIKIGYDPCGGIPEVKTIGIWLPAGFDYDGDCSLEGKDYYSEPAVTSYKGGCAVVWSFSPFVSLAEFADSFTFLYSGPQGQIPSAALSWIDTTWSGIIPGYTWDADVNVYKIISTATDPDTGSGTTIESYTSKVELRRLGAAMSGDYLAIGNTLMTPTDSIYYRNRLYRETSATVAEGDIPSNAMIEAAFLYWSGWIEEGSEGTAVFEENCSDFNAPAMAWTHGNAWDISSGEFRGTAYNKGSNPGRYLTMNSNIDLGAHAGQTVEISWEQDEDGDLEDSDRLYYAFSGDGGSTWSADYEAFRDDHPTRDFVDTIPDAYVTANFSLRFYLYGFSNRNEYCYIDDITITADLPLVEIAKVNRVMFGTTDNMTQITAAPDDCQVEATPDAVEGSWSYSCCYDATDITRALLDPHTKSGTFTLGHVLEGSGYNLYPSGTTAYPLGTPAQKSWFWGYPTQYQWTYAGWSLLIVYSSPGTKGHQLYLFDTFRYVGLDTLLTFPVYNFLAPDDTTGSHLTYFVGEGDNHYSGDYIKLNGYQLPRSGDPYEDPPVNPQNNVFNSYSNSLDDPYLSGVDIDTFDVSSCIAPGDTTAEVVLDNGQEIYDFVYIILSFRSLVTGGGIMGYLIRG